MCVKDAAGAPLSVRLLPSNLAAGHDEYDPTAGKDLPRWDRVGVDSSSSQRSHRLTRGSRPRVSWHTANTKILAEGRHRLIDVPTRFNGVTTISVDE